MHDYLLRYLFWVRVFAISGLLAAAVAGYGFLLAYASTSKHPWRTVPPLIVLLLLVLCGVLALLPLT